MPIVFVLMMLWTALPVMGGGYKSESGPYRVDVTDRITLDDARRDAPLTARVYAPVRSDDEADPEPFPLVVFSHGLGGSRAAFERECNHWASHGYVVVCPEHTDSGAMREDRQRGRAMLRSPEHWERRVLDQKLVIDRIETWAAQVEALGAGDIDQERIASAGHSFGAHTSVLMGGALVDTGEQDLTSHRDERIDCVVAISNQGVGAMGFAEKSWAPMHLPVLFVTGTKDGGQRGMTPEDRLRAFELAPPGDKHALLIENASHSSFQERSGRRSSLRSGNAAETYRAIAHHTRQVVLAFLDAHLKGDEKAIAYLSTAGDEGPAAVGDSRAAFRSR